MPDRGRTFTIVAPSLREAIRKLKKELGPQAMIASMRSTDAGVEIVARLPEGRESRRALRKEVSEIRGMVSDLLKRSGRRPPPASSATVISLYERMLERDVAEELARGLARRIERELPEADLLPERARGLLARYMERLMPCSGPTAPRKGMKTVVVLVGPTGVGKTTTIAKLAASFRLKRGFEVGLVAADTYRIAAVDQLRRYAVLMDAPLAVAPTPEELAKALHEFKGVDVVFVDTPGRSPRDARRMDQLKGLVEASAADEVHLVLSATTREAVAVEVARRFSDLKPDRLIVTKIDESPTLGHLVGCIIRAGIPVSYITTGQDVPDDMEPATASRLAELVLGGEECSDSLRFSA